MITAQKDKKKKKLELELKKSGTPQTVAASNGIYYDRLGRKW